MQAGNPIQTVTKIQTMTIESDIVELICHTLTGLAVLNALVFLRLFTVNHIRYLW